MRLLSVGTNFTLRKKILTFNILTDIWQTLSVDAHNWGLPESVLPDYCELIIP